MRSILENQVILGPLTKGGNLPFRRLCVDFGAKITVSEMAYSRQVCRNSGREKALLRKHASENMFGVQLAATNSDEAVQAGLMAVEQGAKFIDLNVGCPIHDTVRRGMGACLLQRPRSLAKIVDGMVKGLPVPVTVKIRIGWSQDDINALETSKAVEEAGASAITVHGRTREQRYTKSANWDVIKQVVAERTIPVIGNGDILTHYEATARREHSNCAAVMLARGVLIKPWLFKEIIEQKTWLPSAEERAGVYFQFVQYLKEHFRDDEKGHKRAMFFLPWHFSFFSRYRPLPEEIWKAKSLEHPLLQTRPEDETPSDPLERILRDPREEVHAKIAQALWDSQSAADACTRLTDLSLVTPASQEEYMEIGVSTG